MERNGFCGTEQIYSWTGTNFVKRNGFTHGPERIGMDLSFNPGPYRAHGPCESRPGPGSGPKLQGLKGMHDLDAA